MGVMYCQVSTFFQPHSEGIFEGEEYDFEKASMDKIYILHDLQDDHFTWMQNMQM